MNNLSNRLVSRQTKHGGIEPVHLVGGNRVPDHQKRLRVLVATPHGLGGRGGIDRMNDMAIEVISTSPELNVTAERLVTRGRGSLIFAPMVFALALTRLWLAARRGKVDVLHICLSLKGSAYRKALVARVARHCGVPYVVHLHGGGFEYFWLTAGARVRRAVDRLFLESGKIVVLGRYWAGVFAGWLPQTDGRVVVLANATPGSTIDNEPSKDGQVRLTFLGELGRRKGTPQLMEALGRLAGREDWTATLGGNGDVEETRACAQRLGLAERVEIPGWLDAEATARVLRRSDILVLPTFIENLPMIILEAFACGIPVITTPVAAITEVVEHERNGLLVPVGDIGALADALRRLIDDRELRQRLGRTARADHARAYDIRDYVARLVNLWREAAQQSELRQSSDACHDPIREWSGAAAPSSKVSTSSWSA
jgi:glycosyltransferase involved in cell wall biosynthesis